MSVGYQALHLPDNWVNAGFNFDISVPVRGRASIVGEFGLAHQGSSGSDPVTANILHFAAGPRWRWPELRAMPFAHILAGGEVTSANIPVAGGATREDSDGAFMLQPGAGVYFPFNERAGFVGQADLRTVFFGEETDNQFRIVLGVRFALR